MEKEKIRCRGVLYDIEDIISNGNTLTIIFTDIDIPYLVKDMSIFDTIEIITRSGLVAGELIGYNKLVDTTVNSVTLCNDSDVYSNKYSQLYSNVEVIDDEYITIEDIKIKKIEELKHICDQSIIAGVTINGKHYSYTLEDQNNIKDAFDIALQTGLNVPYHADGESCRLYSPDEIKYIFVHAKTNLTHHTTYYNQLRTYVNNLETVEDVENVYYGQELTGEYLNAYNVMMDQATLVIRTLLGLTEKEGLY